MRPFGATFLAFAIGVALLGLSGCAWGGAGVGAVAVLLLFFCAACGGQAIADGEAVSTGGQAGEAGAGGTGGSAGAAGTGGAGGTAGLGGAAGSGGVAGDGGTAGSGGSGLCGNGVCPPHMTCGTKQGEPWCFPDADQDVFQDGEDNCPYASNATQSDADGDASGDACDVCDGPDTNYPCGAECCSDPDGDEVPGINPYPGMSTGLDNCPYLANPDQLDTDGDSVGDACDLSPEEYNPMSPCGDPNLDSDGDGVADLNYCGTTEFDNCKYTPSGTAADLDQDGVGDVCDPDGVPPQPPGGSALAPSPSELRWSRRQELLQRYRDSGLLDPETVLVASSRSPERAA